MSKKSDKFRYYIEDKYRGQRVLSPITEEEHVVQDIADLCWINLDEDDQFLALRKDIGWAWGMRRQIKGKSVVRGILFRPIAREFILSSKPYNYLSGGYGSGKSFAGCTCVAMVVCTYPGSKALIMRTSAKQIRTTTLRMLTTNVFRQLSIYEDEHYRDYKDDKEPHLELFLSNRKEENSRVFYAPLKEQRSSTLEKIMDDAKSFNIDVLLIDEPVYMERRQWIAYKARVGRGDEAVVSVPSHLQRGLLVGNPPSRDHYLNRNFAIGLEYDSEEKLNDAEDHKMFIQTSYNNRSGIKKRVLKGYEDLPLGWRKTFLHGEPGTVEHRGVAVYKDYFNSDQHVSYEPIPYIPGDVLIRGWDLSPTGKDKACVIAQLDRFGTLRVLQEVFSSRVSIEKFIEGVEDVCTKRFPNIGSYQDYADPAAWTKIQQGNQKSPAQLMRQTGLTPLKGQSHFRVRSGAVETLLGSLAKEGRPGILIDNENCRLLVAGFEGGYAYDEKDSQEGIYSPEPLKNIHSHCMDALQYLASRVKGIKIRQQGATEERRQEIKKRRYRGGTEWDEDQSHSTRRHGKARRRFNYA